MVKSVYPKLYYVGQNNLIFTVQNFANWMTQGLIQAIIIFVFHIYSFNTGGMNDNGFVPDLWGFSISIYTSIVLIVDLKLIMNTQFYT